MNSFGPIEIGLIVAIVVAVICLILFIVALKSKKKAQEKVEAQYKSREQQLSDEHEEELEKERIENKKTVTKQKEEYTAAVNSKDREIDALKLFSKNQSEYVTDMRLIGIRERLVNEKRIRPEDMHIMANIFLPRNEFSDVQRISHLVLTRTGLYIIDSQLLKDALSFVNYTTHLNEIERLAGDIQTELNLKFTPTTILYFNPKNDGDVTITNYAQSSNSKVLVGPEQLDEFFNKFVFHGRIQYNVEDLQRVMDEIESFN